LDPTSEDIKAARSAYAEELRYVAHVKSQRVIDAFATAPRELFLGPRPWRIFNFIDGYWEAPGNDPRSAYHNVLFAIDEARRLNNGQPEFWAQLLDKLDVRAGDRALHIGAGLGYYTAIVAELVGRGGSVVAVEIDATLAGRARANLASWKQVEVVSADGALLDPGQVDVIIVSAGATHPMPIWLAALRPGGRMLLPLTAGGTSHGAVFRIERSSQRDRFLATAISGVSIYPCAGARTPEGERDLAHSLARGGQRFVRSIRLDAHERDENCWLHGEGYCFSTLS
jgi:protein-L-isoaspartate(D-aspartate) O-methyltransferase